MKISNPSLATACLLSVFPAYSQVHPTADARPMYNVHLMLVGDARFTTSKMILRRLSADQLSGGVSTDYAMQTIGTAIAGQVANEAANVFAHTLYTAYSTSYLSYVGIIYTVADIVLTIASAGNSQSRDYFIFTPAEAYYSFNISIPGDIDKPCSMVKISSIDTSGNSTQRFYEEIVAGSNQTFDRRVYLPKGLCRVNVSLGSGSVKFHTAGTLNQAMLDNPTPVTWTVSNAPATVGSFPLLQYLPTVGSSSVVSMNFTQPTLPSGMLNGSVSYSNIHPMPAIMPGHNRDAFFMIDFYAAPTPEERALLGTWPSINMDATSTGDPIDTGDGGTWQFTRLPDYTTNTVYRGRYHLYDK